MRLAFLCQDWTDPYNVGGLFRVADACGAAEVILTGRAATPGHPQVAVTSLGHHRRVNWRHFERHEEAAKQLRQDGYTLVAVEISEAAVSYKEFRYPEKLCLVLGTEVEGIYGTVLKHCDAVVLIPMAGKGRSLNVHVAAAIVAFEACLQSENVSSEATSMSTPIDLPD